MPIDYKKYPSNWKTEIRPAILARANNCCEFCGVRNYAIGYRDKNDCWHDIEKSFAGDMIAEGARDRGYKVIKIVLTIAHLDHDVNNNDFSNLKALCQRCHNRYDVGFRKENRKINKGVLSLF
jgi:glyoxylase-like metal-dependent hydrolase (beta-lactamase superfamily II)